MGKNTRRADEKEGCCDVMKNRKKNAAEIERFCRFCEHAALLEDGETVLCGKKGIVGAGYVCGKFIYDPLKREPKRLVKEVKLDYVEL